MQDEEVGQNIDHIDRLEVAGDTDRQAFMSELVGHVEHPIAGSIMGALLDEVVGLDMIAVLRPQADARSVRQPSLPCLVPAMVVSVSAAAVNSNPQSLGDGSQRGRQREHHMEVGNWQEFSLGNFQTALR